MLPEQLVETIMFEKRQILHSCQTVRVWSPKLPVIPILKFIVDELNQNLPTRPANTGYRADSLHQGEHLIFFPVLPIAPLLVQKGAARHNQRFADSLRTSLLTERVIAKAALPINPAGSLRRQPESRIEMENGSISHHQSGRGNRLIAQTLILAPIASQPFQNRSTAGGMRAESSHQESSLQAHFETGDRTMT